MSLMREAIARAMNPHTLLADPGGDSAAQLAALAFCDPLGALLWRLKYGGDLRVAHDARRLLSDVIRTARRFSRWHQARGRRGLAGRGRRETPAGPTPADLADQLAGRVLVEWLRDRCPSCHGKGTLGGEQYLGSLVWARCKACKASGEGTVPPPLPKADPKAKRPKLTRRLNNVELGAADCLICHGKGRVQVPRTEPQPTHICHDCRGTGRPRVSDGERALALGLALDTYRRHWQAVFTELLNSLESIDLVVEQQLRAQLRPGQVQDGPNMEFAERLARRLHSVNGISIVRAIREGVGVLGPLSSQEPDMQVSPPVGTAGHSEQQQQQDAVATGGPAETASQMVASVRP